MMDMPYFMEDESWYYFDLKKRKYVLTDEAPEKARQSYVEYYEEMIINGRTADKPQKRDDRRKERSY